jgi:uncharacterized alpha-E superfamily protein
MGRYVERAEHVARNLLVTTDLLTDVGDMAPMLRQRLWLAVLQVTDLDARMPESHNGDGDSTLRIPAFMSFDTINSSSIFSCITRARDNARSIRESISAEMWESLNTMYWAIRVDEASSKFEESPAEFYRSILSGSMLFQGLTDQTMPHGQPWQFIQVGKHLERVDMTCRILETRYNLLRTAEGSMEPGLRNILWMSLLRCCCSIEAYRRMYLADFEPLRVATFVLFEPIFPRSIRYSVDRAQEAMAVIRELTSSTHHNEGGAERILGRLNADLEFADAEALLRGGLPSYLHNIRQHTAAAAAAIQRSYFIS